MPIEKTTISIANVTNLHKPFHLYNTKMIVIDTIITEASAIIKVVISRILKYYPLNRPLFKESVVIKYNNSKKDKCYI